MKNCKNKTKQPQDFAEIMLRDSFQHIRDNPEEYMNFGFLPEYLINGKIEHNDTLRFRLNEIKAEIWSLIKDTFTPSEEEVSNLCKEIRQQENKRISLEQAKRMLLEKREPLITKCFNEAVAAFEKEIIYLFDQRINSSTWEIIIEVTKQSFLDSNLKKRFESIAKRAQEINRWKYDLRTGRRIELTKKRLTAIIDEALNKITNSSRLTQDQVTKIINEKYGLKLTKDSLSEHIREKKISWKAMKIKRKQELNT